LRASGPAGARRFSGGRDLRPLAQGRVPRHL